MELSITGRHAPITDRFRDYVSEKTAKVTQLAHQPQALQVRLSRHNDAFGNSGPDRVEITLVAKGPIVRAEAEGSDKYAAFDVAISRLLERLRRAKDRKKVHRGRHRPVSLREAAADDFHVVGLQPADGEALDRVQTGEIALPSATSAAEDDDSPIVIRRKVFAAEAMSLDDALYQMELVGHDFFLFVDAETDRPSVVYRRKGWDYGVIGLDLEAAQAKSA